MQKLRSSEVPEMEEHTSRGHVLSVKMFETFFKNMFMSLKLILTKFPSSQIPFIHPVVVMLLIESDICLVRGARIIS